MIDTIKIDDLKAVLGVKEATRIQKLVEAAYVEPLFTDQLETMHYFLDNNFYAGKQQAKIIPVLREFLRTHPRTATALRQWLDTIEVTN